MTHILDEHEALSIGDDLRSIESLLQVVNELLSVTLEIGLGALEDLARADTLLLKGAQAAGKHGLADERDGHAEIESVHSGPLASSLLTSSVEDLVQDWGSVVVLVAEDIASDLDEERVQDARVPLVEHVGHLVLGHSQAALHNVVGLYTGTSG